MTRHAKFSAALLVVAACLVAEYQSATQSRQVHFLYLPFVARSETLRERYGIGGGGQYDPALGVTWWRDWDASYNYPPGGSRPPHKMWTVGKLNNRTDATCRPGTYAATRANIDAIFACEQASIASVIAAGYIGQYWEIANEPNWQPHYAPADYAYQFTLYRIFISGLDPSARFVVGGLPLCVDWQAWTDAVVAAGIAPDVWGIHPYSVPLSVDNSTGQIVTFRQYLSQREIYAPIWLTEFGYGGWGYYDPALIAQFASGMGDWLNAHYAEYNVERWFWWGVLRGDAGMGPGGLFSAAPYNDATMTVVGHAYFDARDNQ